MKRKHKQPEATGQHLKLLQDECRELSIWFASRLDARWVVCQVFNLTTCKRNIVFH